MTHVPYVLTPRWVRRTLAVLASVQYGMCLVMGVGAVWLTPTTITARVDGTVTDIWGVLALAGALPCLIGALRRRYPMELIGLPLLMGAVFVYAVTVWDATLDVPTRLAQAAAITSLFLGFAIRYTYLLGVRARERIEARTRGRA